MSGGAVSSFRVAESAQPREEEEEGEGETRRNGMREEKEREMERKRDMEGARGMEQCVNYEATSMAAKLLAARMQRFLLSCTTA